MREAEWNALKRKREDKQDHLFVENANWMAFQTNSYSWPKHWRAAIFKLSKVLDVTTGQSVYDVYPRNPEYDNYIATEVWENPPPMHLGLVRFDSIELLDQWARVAARLSK